MRDAHGRSNVLRPLQRRFKARKKPDGYTSTPTGLKRLKTQNTAFHGNGNGKGTPSGVPQPIHKRKLVLVKEEFDASSFGGDEGNRTLGLCHATAALSQLSYVPRRVCALVIVPCLSRLSNENLARMKDCVMRAEQSPAMQRRLSRMGRKSSAA